MARMADDGRGGVCRGLGGCLSLLAGFAACAGAFLLVLVWLGASETGRGGKVWITESGGSYHRSNCRSLAQSEPMEVPLRQALADGRRPCGLCDPPVTERA